MDSFDPSSGQPIPPGSRSSTPETTSGDQESRTPSVTPSTVSTGSSYPLRSGRALESRPTVSMSPTPRHSITPVPVKLESIAPNRYRVPRAAMDSFQNVISYEELLDIQQQRKRMPLVSSGPSAIAGTGVIASIAFEPHEIIGIYEGQEVRRRRLNSQWERTYRDRTKTPNNDLMSPLYVVYRRDEDGVEYFKESDTHVAWSQVRVHNHKEDIGLNGAEGGNDLAYLNHSNTPNAVLFPVVNPAYLERMSENGTQFINTEGLNRNSILLAVIALKTISVGEEVVFDYGGNPNFEHHGKDIMRFPEMCSRPVGNRMHMLDRKHWLTLAKTKKVAAEMKEARRLLTQMETGVVDQAVMTDTLDTMVFPDRDDDDLTYLPSSESEDEYFPSEAEESSSSDTDSDVDELVVQVPLSSPKPETLERFDFMFRKRPRAGTGKHRQRRAVTRREPEMTPEQQTAYQAAEQAVADIIKGVRRIKAIEKHPKFGQAVKKLTAAVKLEALLADSWNSIAVYEFLEDCGCMTDDTKYLAMPYAVLKERSRNPRQFPDILDKFIICWLEDGRTVGMLHAHFTKYGITPPARFGQLEWDGGIFQHYKERVNPEKLKAKVDEELAQAGPSAFKPKSKKLSKLNVVAEASGTDETALIEYMTQCFHTKKTLIHDLCKQLNTRWTNPASGTKSWSTEEVVSYLINAGILDVDKDEDLLRMPVATVAEVTQDMDNDEAIRAKYLKAMVKEGRGFAGLKAKGASLVGIKPGEKADVVAKAAELLLRHYKPENIIYKHSLDQVCDWLTQLDSTPRGRLAGIPFSKDALTKEMVFRLRCQEPGALEAYVDVRRKLGETNKNTGNPVSKKPRKEVLERDVVLGSIASKLRELGIPLPDQYKTEDSPDEWAPNNLRVMMGMPLVFMY